MLGDEVADVEADVGDSGRRVHGEEAGLGELLAGVVERVLDGVEDGDAELDAHLGDGLGGVDATGVGVVGENLDVEELKWS